MTSRRLSSMATTSNREGRPPRAVVPKPVPSPPRATSEPFSSVICTAPDRTTNTSSLPLPTLIRCVPRRA
jgi:hypothetical protein